MDKIDRKILSELQQNGRMTNVELSKRVNLSPTPCLDRVKRLEREGFITGYVANLDPDKLGYSLIVFVQIVLDRTTNDVFEKFSREIWRMDEVMECHVVAGGFDYLLKLRFSDMKSYRRFLGERLAILPGVSQTHTYLVMEEVKNSTRLPLI